MNHTCIAECSIIIKDRCTIKNHINKTCVSVCGMESLTKSKPKDNGTLCSVMLKFVKRRVLQKCGWTRWIRNNGNKMAVMPINMDSSKVPVS